MKLKAGSRCIAFFFLVSGGWLTGCALPQNRPDVTTSNADDLATATVRVDHAIDAANACVADYMRRYDSPSITPGDVLDAGLAECRPFFTAHRAAVQAMTTMKLEQKGEREAAARAEQEAQRYSESFHRIVRETGLGVLVQRRSALSALKPHPDAGEIQL